jgi:hypothetical protein
LLASIFILRKHRPIAALGLALFFGCHLLTATVLPLELIFEHRNYFASLGLILALIPTLDPINRHRRFALARSVLLVGLLILWTGQTLTTAAEWRNPLSMAQSLADRRPTSPRAEYELGRMFVILSHYDPSSPYTKLAYAPLERSAALPDSSILPEQALIFMNSRMHMPVENAWWDSLIAKLKAHKPGVQDESSLVALTQCTQDRLCDIPVDRMMDAFTAALAHPHPTARLLANYGDYAWNVLGDRTLALRMSEAASKTAPHEPAYLITVVRMLIAMGRPTEAVAAMKRLQPMNIVGRLDKNLAEMRALLGQR